MSVRELAEWTAWYRVSPLAQLGLGIAPGLGGTGMAAPPQTKEQQKAIFAQAAAAFARAQTKSEGKSQK